MANNKDEFKGMTNEKQIMAMIEQGIRCGSAVFIAPIRAAGDAAPVTEVHCAQTNANKKESFHKDKLARIWITPQFLVVAYDRKDREKKTFVEWILVPYANVAYARPL